MVTAKGEFTEILQRRGIISSDQLREAEQMSREQADINVADCLIRLSYATPEEVMRAMAEHHKMEYIDLDEVKIPDAVIELIPESVARENSILPMSENDDRLRVIVSDPMDIETIEKLRFILNRQIDTVLAPRVSIQQAINSCYGQVEGESADSMLQEFTDTAIDFTETEEDTAGQDESVDENSAPVVRLVQMMISEAVQVRASDIHVEPFEDRIRIRYRIDGILVERDSPPRRLLSAILSRIKILAKMDIAERRRPQDGRIKVTVGEKELDLRVSVIPTNHGQSCVMRLLDKDNIKVGIRQLGLSQYNFDRFQHLIKRPNGIVLVTGPTGSGKTTTLYSALSELNDVTDKLITTEDPVEYDIDGIIQIPIDADIEVTFAQCLRAILRQDPDKILVGEIRDLETAEIAVQASLTGHTVFSTLHTNDAPSTVTRMKDMGVPTFLITATVEAILAQRLVRRICSQCREEIECPPDLLSELQIAEEDLANYQFYRGKGCDICNNTGYKGRVGLFELMIMNDHLRNMIMENASIDDLREAAQGFGMYSLRDAGIDMMTKGITTPDEVVRETIIDA